MNLASVAPEAPAHQIECVRNLVYGRGRVGRERPGGPVERELTLDLYRPVDPLPAGQLMPALILAFGGAFHRGCKEDDAFEAEGGNTAVAEYCRRFARRGYVACTIDYRLVPEDPEPGDTPVVGAPERIPTARVDVVRQLMQLPPATPDMLWRGIEAASDDMAAATRFVRRQADAWQVDPARIAIGGFSAGARTALNVAFGEQVPVAAVVALSGYVDDDDLQRHLARCSGQGPAVLVASAEHDLDYVAAAAPGLVARLRQAGLNCTQVRVPGAGHFYRAEAAVLRDDGGPTTVEGAMADFLHRTLAPVGSASSSGEPQWPGARAALGIGL
ncbi:alpha/beta hydrolase [Variovorax sp. KK3]|uniref:alpha/beta hydrolase n=1 Tax=Variovorax sp. KK3 TaxID=1855728 RepID=UPI00097C537D|nr:alpha/beta hydrolase [Variovorax sp. KK3]